MNDETVDEMRLDVQVHLHFPDGRNDPSDPELITDWGFDQQMSLETAQQLYDLLGNVRGVVRHDTHGPATVKPTHWHSPYTSNPNQSPPQVTWSGNGDWDTYTRPA